MHKLEYSCNVSAHSSLVQNLFEPSCGFLPHHVLACLHAGGAFSVAPALLPRNPPSRFGSLVHLQPVLKCLWLLMCITNCLSSWKECDKFVIALIPHRNHRVCIVFYLILIVSRGGSFQKSKTRGSTTRISYCFFCPAGRPVSCCCLFLFAA